MGRKYAAPSERAAAAMRARKPGRSVFISNWRPRRDRWSAIARLGTPCGRRLLGGVTEAEFYRHVRIRRRDTQISLHLLMQRRAEISAIEGSDADAVRDELQGCRLAGHDEQLRTRSLDGESMGNIPVLLEICHMEKDGI